MHSLQQSTAVLAEAQQVESLASNIQTLLNKGYRIDEIFLTAGEFLADEEEPTLTSANVYLLNWARNDGTWAVTL